MQITSPLGTAPQQAHAVQISTPTVAAASTVRADTVVSSFDCMAVVQARTPTHTVNSATQTDATRGSAATDVTSWTAVQLAATAQHARELAALRCELRSSKEREAALVLELMQSKAPGTGDIIVQHSNRAVDEPASHEIWRLQTECERQKALLQSQREEVKTRPGHCCQQSIGWP